MATGGRYAVWLVRDGVQETPSVFKSTAVGMQWAVDVLRELTDEGWTKTY
jgi:hypothetical protein